MYTPTCIISSFIVEQVHARSRHFIVTRERNDKRKLVVVEVTSCSLSLSLSSPSLFLSLSLNQWITTVPCRKA